MLSFAHYHANFWSEVFAARGLLAGIWDDDPDRGREAARRFATAYHPEVDALLAGCTAVAVCSETSRHPELIERAAARGLAILTEKPIAATLEAAQRIARAAEEARVLLSVGHIERFNPAIQELKRRLDGGQGGPVLQMRARRVGPFPHRIRDVGVIHDLGPHDIDIMRHLLGDEIERVYAESRSHIATGNEDMFAGLVRFRGGAMGSLDINWLTPTKERSLTVLCEKGMFVVDYAAQSLAFYENFDAAAREGRYASVTEGPMTRYPIPNREPLRVELEAFRDAVLAGGPAPVSAHDGMTALAVAEALVRSGETGMPVQVRQVTSAS